MDAHELSAQLDGRILVAISPSAAATTEDADTLEPRLAFSIALHGSIASGSATYLPKRETGINGLFIDNKSKKEA